MFTTAPTKPCLGILTTRDHGDPPWIERGFYRSLWHAGRHSGIDVIVFFPDRIDTLHGTVDGFTYDPRERRWASASCPMPDLIYDRRFSGGGSRATPRFRILQGGERPRMLGNALGGKWAIHRILRQEEALLPHLPSTLPVRDAGHVLRVLERRGSLFLKPHSGSQGKGALRLVEDPGIGVQACGRDGRNRPVQHAFGSREALGRWLTTFLGRRRYVMQPYLSLTTQDGIAFDIRVLMQKDGTGHWTQTGMAVRQGRPGSVTSNLHGGGSAAAAMPFLQREYGPDEANRIDRQIHDLSERLPSVLEGRLGRLFELGLDFGVDRCGHVWILEVNSKPGRAVFAKIGNKRAKRRSVLNPIHYACYLLDRQHRRVT